MVERVDSQAFTAAKDYCNKKSKAIVQKVVDRLGISTNANYDTLVLYNIPLQWSKDDNGITPTAILLGPFGVWFGEEEGPIRIREIYVIPHAFVSGETVLFQKLVSDRRPSVVLPTEKDSPIEIVTYKLPMEEKKLDKASDLDTLRFRLDRLSDYVSVAPIETLRKNF